MRMDKIIEETRRWIQWFCHNGDKVVWGSDDVLKPEMTVGELERFAKDITTPLLFKIRDLEKEIERLEKLI